jgi:hypothetical protein
MGKRHVIESIPDVFIESASHEQESPFTDDNMFI